MALPSGGGKIAELPQDALEKVKHYFISYQKDLIEIISAFEDGESFISDKWQYDSGNGGGISAVLRGSNVIEQGGVNYSNISADSLPDAATLKRPQLAGVPFQAMGVSVVMHPLNPFCPTSHANLRFFVTKPEGKDQVQWWFGGGFDLTPYYGFVEDVVLWHQHAKSACDKLGATYYEKYKKQCDSYFYLPHRNEARGVGGIFFDDLNAPDFDSCFEFVKQVGRDYLAAYAAILTKRKEHPYSDRHRHYQCYRRGRYVEFNLLYDRGTLFGLQSAGRVESILMSMPPEVSWRYNYTPELASAERVLLDEFLPPRNWLGEV